MKTFFTALRKNKIPYIGFLLFHVTASLIISATYIVTQMITGEMGQAAFEFDTSAILKSLVILTAVIGVRAILAALDELFMGRHEGNAGYKFRVNFVEFFLRCPYVKIEEKNSGKNLA